MNMAEYHMGPEHTSREKILSMVNFLIFVHKNVYDVVSGLMHNAVAMC